jgi:hypothetical protein
MPAVEIEAVAAVTEGGDDDNDDDDNDDDARTGCHAAENPNTSCGAGATFEVTVLAEAASSDRRVCTPAPVAVSATWRRSE